MFDLNDVGMCVCVCVCVCSLCCLCHAYLVCDGHAQDGIRTSGMNGLDVYSTSDICVGCVGVLLLGMVWMPYGVCWL